MDIQIPEKTKKMAITMFLKETDERAYTTANAKLIIQSAQI